MKLIIEMILNIILKSFKNFLKNIVVVQPYNIINVIVIGLMKIQKRVSIISSIIIKIPQKLLIVIEMWKRLKYISTNIHIRRY